MIDAHEDPEPQPGDRPDYHAEHAAWERRQPRPMGDAHEVVVICDDPLYRCRCVKPVGHVDAGDDVHACGEDVCGGSWRWVDEARTRFHAPTNPAGQPRGAVFPPPPAVEDRDGVPFVQVDADGHPTGMIRRGGIRYIQPPALPFGTPDET